MFRRFANFFVRDKPIQTRGTLLGLDYAGKTTILYKLKGGTVTTTIPAIGFNIETVETPNWKLESWDVGGCDKSSPLKQNYLAKTQLLLFVHDCSDQDRLVESIEELQHILNGLAEREGLHAFILLNKQDLFDGAVRSARVGELQQRFEKSVRLWKPKMYIEVMDLPGLNCKNGYQLEQAMTRIKSVIAESDSATALSQQVSSHIDTTAPLPAHPSEAQLRERMTLAVASADSPDKFWNDFLAADLPAWDHFTHLRAGYFIMIDTMSTTGMDIFECTDVFIRHLDRLRSTKPDRFRNTTHRTMTIFWLVQLHNAAVNYNANKNGLKALPGKDDFSAVLYDSPQLMNSGIWRDHYTKEVMFSPEAKAEWRMPDIQPLSTILNLGERTEALKEKS